MTDSNKQKQDDKNRFNQVAAAVTGAVIGAGVAVAGTMVMSSKKNQDKVKKVISDVKEKAVDYIEGIQRKAKDTKEEVEKKFSGGKKKMVKVKDSVKKSFKYAVKDAKKALN